MAMAARTLGQTKTTPFCQILSTLASNSSDRGLQSRTNFPKFEKMFYCRLQIRPARAPKVEQNLQNLKKCSTANSKSAPRASKSRTNFPKFEKMFYRQLQIRPARLRSRQKMRFPTEFCLPLRPIPSHATSNSADHIRHPPHPPSQKSAQKRPDTMPGLISYSIKRPFPS